MGLAPTGSWRASEGVALNVKATRGDNIHLANGVSCRHSYSSVDIYNWCLQGGRKLRLSLKSHKKRQAKVHCEIYTALLSCPMKRLFPSQPIN